ncbi:phage tail tape measure protein [Faecalibacterium prausnitzii]|uniref:phage tail tape measure protein n=1 Tax=Faecalibacterium prausnitzii TaxID=853 RepID=UPI0032BF8064
MTNGMADNTNTASSADTSSVTAIKVKVVLDTTTEELKNQFKGVQNSFKKAPVEIAFGVNEGATIGNVNSALKRIIKKIESPKLTLKIDESNIDAAVKKAVNKAQSGAKNAKTEVKVNLNTNEAKQKLDAFYRRVQEKGSLYKDALKLESSGKNQPELEEVLRQLQAVRNEAGRLRTELVNILPTEEFSKISEIERATTNSISRLEARLQGLKNAANDGALKALKKSQSDQANTYSNNLADANNKYKNFSGASDVKSSLADVQKQIDILNTLETGTQDYANQLKVVADTWADATRQMSTFDEAQKKAENHVKSMTEQALKWKESIKDSDTASQELRDSIDGIIDASKKLDSDHSSDAYKKGVKDLDDAFISAKVSMSVYTDGYKDLESTARRTLTEIRKKELELEQAGNHSFDSILIGDSKTTSLDGSLESQLNSLKGMNTQSATYKQRVSEIVEEWLKVKLQIEQALRSEEDLEKEAEQKHGQVRSKQAAYNTIQNRLSSTEFTRKNSVALGRFNTGVLDDGKTGQQVLAELDAAMKQLDENKGPTEFKATLSQVDDLLVRVRKHIDDALVQSRQTKTANTDTDKIENLMRTLYQYKETLHGFEGSKFEAEYNELFDAIKNGSYSFEEAQMKVSKFQNACHQAGLETETLGQKLSRLFKEHFQTAIAMAGVAMVKQGLREVYNNVLELDTAVTELKKVSSMTGDEMNSYLERTATNARELGASISDLVTSAADWKRLGYSDEDSEELARVAALMANVGDGIDNATTASSYLISTMQGFGLVADDAEHLLDCMNQIANTEPVSMEDLGIIMQKSSAAMSAAGNTYQETLAMASALNGVLQDSESSGTFLKTLSMYLRASKTDAENAGIATDGMASSVSELRSELKQLAGVDIMKNDNTFKSTYQIMKELSEVWKDLSDTTQANITELISGKRGGQGTSALLNNFSVAEDAMKQALNSSGSAMRENETYMQSLQAKLNQLDSAFQKFSTDLMKSDIPKFFVDLATVFVDGADNAVKFAGALPTLTAAISGVLSVMQMSGKLKNGAGKVNMPSYICCV